MNFGKIMEGKIMKTKASQDSLFVVDSPREVNRVNNGYRPSYVIFKYFRMSSYKPPWLE